MAHSFLLLALLSASSVFTDYLDAGPGPARSFSLPTSGRSAVAMAPGTVIEAGDDRVVVEHVFYENHHRRVARVHYDGLAPRAALGPVKARAVLGEGREISVSATVDGEPEPIRALLARRSLAAPLEEPVLVLVDHESYAAEVYVDGARTHALKVGFGQAKGEKTQRGDNRTPKGMYYVVSHHRGEFGGEYGAYYGGHWIKIGYPNAFDAERGVADGLIDEAAAQKIRRAFANRALPPQDTRLGSGIGFHGWAGEWSDDDPHLSWGCIVMHNPDIAEVYDAIPVGAMVVIF